MVGAALMRAAASSSQWDVVVATRQDLDLLDRPSVDVFLRKTRPEMVMVAAAKVGGILANERYPADFLFENLAIASNLVDSCFRSGVRRLLFLGSSCIYPRQAPQPIAESALLTSQLELTNEAYAIAKIAGLKLCSAYRRQHGVLFHSVMPTNLYGPGDNYHPERSHVIPGLLRRFHEAKVAGVPELKIWGSGTPRREFLHVDDLAAACFHLAEIPEPPDWVNVGYGADLTILELAELVAEITGYRGRIETDPTQPDGTPRKLLDGAVMRSLGWSPKIGLREGLALAYRDFLDGWETGTLRSV
jgi:GDP-L-fucose synthase